MAIYTSILTGGSSNHQTTSEEANDLATDFVAEGVVGAITNTSGVAPATGALAVNAQGTPNMTVAVSSGVAYVQATPSGQASQTLRVNNNASANVTIAANSSGSTKYDWVYLSVSAANAANPNVAGDNVTTLVASRSSSATTDDGTPPTYGYPLAVVTVANGASSITNGTIADIRNGALSSSAGFVIQLKETPYSAAGTTSTVIPVDDTIPQNTEGFEAMSQTIRPRSATNKLIIEGVAFLSHSSAASAMTAAVFQDSTANALAATTSVASTATGPAMVPFYHSMVAGTTISTTFRVRVGSNLAGTTTFNGNSGARLFGAISKSWIKVTEVAP